MCLVAKQSLTAVHNYFHIWCFKQLHKKSITGCAVAPALCLTATGQVNGRWRILTPDRIETHEPTCNKITHNWLRPREDPLNQIWYKSIHWGLLGIWWNITFLCLFLFIYLYLFFWDSRTGQTGWWIFTRNSSLDVKSYKDVPFRGCKT